MSKQARESTPNPTSRVSIAQVGLVALFVTALITAQLTAAKVLALPIPFSLPLVGSTIILPGAAVAYAVTYLASDCYTELFGRRAAQVVINLAFAMNFVMLGLLWTTLSAPGINPEFASTFNAALSPATNIVLGSLLAYLLSQNWDVVVFHWIRDQTDGAYLWLRNIGSTATSQALDTVVFVGIAFLIAPLVLGTGDALSLRQIAALIIGQYLLKLVIALVDTPLVYLIVGTVQSGSPDTETPTDSEVIERN
jgi:uncharacterized integral membrane protein (TIGR00697 family)